MESLLRETMTMFGEGQVRSYAALISKAVELISEDPTRPSSLAWPDIGSGIRSLHLEIAGGRRGSASHQVFYTVRAAPDGLLEVVVLRVLHDAMEPRRRVTRALSEEGPPKPGSGG